MPDSSRVRESFEKAFDLKFKKIDAYKVEYWDCNEHEAALWACQWAFEKAAEEAEQTEFDSEEGSRIAKKIRNLAKELSNERGEVGV